MKLAGLLNLKGISGQIAALVVTSLVTLHLIITATLLISRPDQPDPRVDRGHSQLATVIQLIGTAAADRRNRPGVSTTRHPERCAWPAGGEDQTERPQHGQPASPPRPRLPGILAGV